MSESAAAMTFEYFPDYVCKNVKFYTVKIMCILEKPILCGEKEHTTEFNAN